MNPLTSLLSHPRLDTEEDMISNPSDDNVNYPFAHPFHHSSRPPSSRLSFHNPALAHSCMPSSNLMLTPFQLPMPIPIQAPVPKHTEALNPHAKPFVFTSAKRRSGSRRLAFPCRNHKFNSSHKSLNYLRHLGMLVRPHLASPSMLGCQSSNRVHLRSHHHQTCPSSPCHSLQSPLQLSPRPHRPLVWI